jgi:AraC family transcriptional regulator
MDRRIDESMRLLASTDQPIVDIALEMGFSSQSHFTDAFTRRAGIPPGRWRDATR